MFSWNPWSSSFLYSLVLQHPSRLILYLENGTREAQQWGNQGVRTLSILDLCQGLSHRRCIVLCFIMIERTFSDIMMYFRIRFAKLLPNSCVSQCRKGLDIWTTLCSAPFHLSWPLASPVCLSLDEMAHETQGLPISENPQTSASKCVSVCVRMCIFGKGREEWGNDFHSVVWGPMYWKTYPYRQKKKKKKKKDCKNSSFAEFGVDSYRDLEKRVWKIHHVVIHSQKACSDL